MKTGCRYCGPDYERSAGNDSIMWLILVSLYYFFYFVLIIEILSNSSHITHLHSLCIDVYRFLDSLLIGAIRGESKNKFLYSKYSPIKGFWDDNSLNSKIYEVASKKII